MNHDEATEKLDAYVAGTLGAEQAGEMDAHVAECEDCQAELAPVDLAGFDPSDDGEQVQASVRKAMRRTALAAAAYAVMATVVLLIATVLVVQPLLLARFDRAAMAARAAYEVPMLFNPGVQVDELTIRSGLAHRTTTVTVGIPLGSGTHPVGPFGAEVTVFGMDIKMNAGSQDPTITDAVLPGLDDGTVVTVEVGLPEPLDIEAAQALASDPGRDVRITWVGFGLPSRSFRPIGYPICRQADTPSDRLLGATSASWGGTWTGVVPDVRGAVDKAAAGLEAISSQSEVADTVGGRMELRSIVAALKDGDPAITSVVVTGPTPEVVAFLADTGIPHGAVLAVGFYDWGSPVCGR